jgi:hypothetical protein
MAEPRILLPCDRSALRTAYRFLQSSFGKATVAPPLANPAKHFVENLSLAAQSGFTGTPHQKVRPAHGEGIRRPFAAERFYGQLIGFGRQAGGRHKFRLESQRVARTERPPTRRRTRMTGRFVCPTRPSLPNSDILGSKHP